MTACSFGLFCLLTFVYTWYCFLLQLKSPLIKRGLVMWIENSKSGLKYNELQSTLKFSFIFVLCIYFYANFLFLCILSREQLSLRFGNKADGCNRLIFLKYMRRWEQFIFKWRSRFLDLYKKESLLCITLVIISLIFLTVKTMSCNYPKSLISYG